MRLTTHDSIFGNTVINVCLQYMNTNKGTILFIKFITFFFFSMMLVFEKENFSKHTLKHNCKVKPIKDY